MELGEKLGQGRIGEVFAYGASQAVKLFYPGTPAAYIDHELRMSALMNDAELPTAKVYDKVTVNGRTGIVYDRVDGPTFLRLILTEPCKLTWIAEASAQLHAKVHRCRNDRLPSQKEMLEKNIIESDINQELREKAMFILNGLPDADEICHGDFHPDNLVLSHSGPVILDWANARRGNRIADFVRSALILKVASLPDHIEHAGHFNKARRQLYKTYTETYLHLYPAKRDDIVRWIAPVAITRLKDNIPSERAHLLRIIRKSLSRE